MFEGATLEWLDERFHYDEERSIAISIAQGQEILVVFVDEEETRRILSARPTTQGERVLYWNTVGAQE